MRLRPGETLRRHRELQQRHPQRTVVEGVELVGAQAEEPAELAVVDQHRRTPADEHGAQAFAEQRVQADELGGGAAQAGAVGRVGYEQPGHGVGAGRRRELGELAPLHAHERRESCSRRVVAGQGDGPWIMVVARDDLGADAGDGQNARKAGVAALLGVGDETAPESIVVAQPAVEAETAGLGAQQPGGHVAGDEGRLDGQRAGPAQRVDQAAAGGGQRRPAGAHEDGRGEVLLERRGDLHTLLAVAPPVQALAREVEAHRRLLALDVDVDAHIGPCRIDAWPLARRCA